VRNGRVRFVLWGGKDAVGLIVPRGLRNGLRRELNVLVGFSGSESLRPFGGVLTDPRVDHHNVFWLNSVLINHIDSILEAAHFLLGLMASARDSNVSELRVEEGFSFVSVVHHFLVDLFGLSFIGGHIFDVSVNKNLFDSLV